MSKIEGAIEDFIQQHLQNCDLGDMITTEVRDTWDMDELDRVDDTVDRVDSIETWIVDVEDKFSPQNVIDLENSVKNLVEHGEEREVCIKHLLVRIKDLEDRLNDYEEIREMAWQSANKSFFQKLIFWR